MDVQASGLLGGWTQLNTISTVPIPGLNNHCFVPNADGSKYYMFGGSFMADNKLNGELFILDVQSKSWSRALMASPRTKMACAVAGNSLVVWGGKVYRRNNTLCQSCYQCKLDDEGFLTVDFNHVGYQDIGETLLVDNRPIIFDIAQGEWVQRFTTTFNPFAPSTPNAGSASPAQGSSAPKSGSNMGAIVGGSVGALAVVALIAGLFIFRHQRRNSGHRKGFATRDGPSASSGGKGDMGNGELSKGEVEMGGYKTIPSPFSTDDTALFNNGSHPHQNQYLPDNASFPQQRPLQQQPPVIASRPAMTSSHPRALSQLSNTVPHIIASPFDTEADASLQHPLLYQPNEPHLRSVPLPPLAPRPPSVQYQYHGQLPRRKDDDDDDHDDDRMSTVLSRSLEPTTVDLIPISASEAGDGSLHSRTNSVSSNRSLSSKPRTTRTTSRRNNSSNVKGAAGTTSGVDNDRRLLEEPGDGRRLSTDSLDYLDIS
ncbi:hypothetical protein BGZ68_001678 [Mortierella alpina]|nr:hypothetical protein BGZ68_001678 [Mortierella alpina]